MTLPVSRTLAVGAIAALITALTAAGPATAQDASSDADTIADTLDSEVIDVIIVTAAKRETVLEDTPLSLSVVSSEFLEIQGIGDIQSLFASVPGLQFQNIGGPGQSRVTIRGVSTGSGVSTVGVYIDEVPVTSPVVQSTQLDFGFFDLARVEVLRGPQGTLYGEGSVGGTIRYVTNQPDPSAFDVAGAVTGGSTEDGDSMFETNAMVNVPLVEDRWALRLVGTWRDFGGWIDNGRLGLEDTNEVESAGLRSAIRYTGDDDLRLTGAIHYWNVDQADQPQFYSDQDFLLEPDRVGSSEEDYLLYNVVAEFPVGSVDLLSSTSYLDRERSLIEANPVLEAFFFGPGTEPVTNSDFTISSLVQELRGTTNAGGPLQLTAGAFYKKEERDIQVVVTNTFPFAPPESRINTIDETEQVALFGELTYYDLFIPGLEATVGLRWANETRDQSNTSAVSIPGIPPVVTSSVDTLDSDFLSPRFTLAYDFGDSALVYATVSRGFRSGGFNQDFTGSGGPPASTYDEDSVWNYELGWRTQWFDDRLTLSGAAYYLDWEDLQSVLPINALFGTVENVGDAHSTGLDLELTWTPVDNLNITAAGNLTEAELDGETVGTMWIGPPDLPFPFFTSALVPKGTRLAAVPEYTFSLAFDYRRPIGAGFDAVFRGSYQAVGDRYGALFDNSTPPDLPSYELLGLRAGVETDRWSIIGFVDNVTDEQVVFAPGQFPVGIEPGAVPGSYTVNRPRTVGVRVSYRGR